MDIGREIRTYTIEPVAPPVPVRVPDVAPAPAEPATVPA